MQVLQAVVAGVRITTPVWMDFSEAKTSFLSLIIASIPILMVLINYFWLPKEFNMEISVRSLLVKAPFSLYRKFVYI